MLASSKTVAPTVAAFASACIAIACSSSSPSAPPTAASCDSAPVSFRSDLIPTFATNCTATTICHGQKQDAEAENLYLGAGSDSAPSSADDIAAIYKSLVGVKSIEDPLMNLVTASDLENSFLWHKVDGDQNGDSKVVAGCQPVAKGSSACSDCLPEAPCGAQMPFGSLLDPAAVCVIRTWIAQGAKND
jgi:hypothetical protein